MNQKTIMLISVVAIYVLTSTLLMAGTIPIEDIKAIVAESSENMKNEKVIRVLLQPGEVAFKRTKGWAIFTSTAMKKNVEGVLVTTDENADMMFAEYEKVRPPLPTYNLKPLKKYAYVGKPNYALVKAYVAQRTDKPDEYFAVLASRNELMIYTKDKRTYFANLEPLDIKLSPTMFFSYGEDKGIPYIKILVVDEDEVKNLHTGNVKTVVFKLCLSEMKISATGFITDEKPLYEWKGKREY